MVRCERARNGKGTAQSEAHLLLLPDLDQSGDHLGSLLGHLAARLTEAETRVIDLNELNARLEGDVDFELAERKNMVAGLTSELDRLQREALEVHEELVIPAVLQTRPAGDARAACTALAQT